MYPGQNPDALLVQNKAMVRIPKRLPVAIGIKYSMHATEFRREIRQLVKELN